MAFDLVVKNGMVVDGTGFARYRADVGVANGVITEIGKLGSASAETTIDADGQFVAPGVIDLHTHYDAQRYWDRLCTSSIWHGVTTVLMGNCGLTLAPLRPEHRDTMLATFCCVEDIPVESLASLLRWEWETFAEYLDAIDVGLGLNVMPLVGHNPLRLCAMGQAAWERAATEDEVAEMQRLLRASLDAGAWGWSTTVSPTHAGPKGEPVPTRLADNAERVALGRTLGEYNRGVIEILPPGAARPDEADRAHLREVALSSGRRVFFLVFGAEAREFMDGATRQGAQLTALLRAIPFNPRFTLKKTAFFNNLDGWDTAMARPFEERLAFLGDPGRRATLLHQAVQRQRRRPGVPGRFVPWESIVVKRVNLEAHRALEGRGLAEIAETRSAHAADVMLDLAVAEGLETEFQVLTRSPEEEAALAEFVKTGHALPSQTDAGAHLNSNPCTAGESSYVLGEWVRERQFLTLEDAVRRLTFQPARLMGLRDRGLVREGMVADLMVFDPTRIGVAEDEIARDGPNGAPRRVQAAEGVHHVIVGGQPVLDHGQHTGALPGRVLRAGPVLTPA
jgi:N-acyl-D-aspartate/D-glutamate deacylase